MVIRKIIKPKNEKSSILKRFVAYAIFIVVVFAAVLLWMGWKGYQTQLELARLKLESQAIRINQSLVDTVRYTESLLVHINSQIKQNPSDPEYISKVLKSFRNLYKDDTSDILSLSMFSWVNTNHQLVVNSELGVLEKAKDLSTRDYIPRTVANPNKIQMGAPLAGAVSGQWIIPAGVGVFDDDGSYLGTTVVGVDINGLLGKLNTVVDKSFATFALVDKGRKPIISFTGMDNTQSNDFLASLDQFEALGVSGVFRKPSVWEREKELLLYQNSDYPYTIFVKYDTELLNAEIRNIILSRVGVFLLITLVIVALLVVMRKYIVTPIIKLSNVADKIAEGKEEISIPEHSSYELNNLAEQIGKVKYSIESEKKVKEKLAQYIKVAEESDQAREKFVNMIRYEMLGPLHTIIKSSQTLLNHFELDDGMRKYLKDAYDAAIHIKVMTSDTLNITSVDVSEVIEESVMIHLKGAQNRDIEIVSKISSKVSTIYADELRFKQIIVGLLHRCINYLPDNSKIVIAAKSKEEEQQKSLVVTIRDNGFGFDGDFREDFREQDYLRYKLDGTDSRIETLERLIGLHGGRLVIKDRLGKGSTIKAIFPYRETPEMPEDSYSSVVNVVPLFKEKKK